MFSGTKKLFYIALTIALVFLMAIGASAAAEDNVQLSDDASGFVLLSEAVPDAILEIRYYSTYNFVGDRITGYEEPVALLTKEAAAALREVSDDLVEQGYRLKVFDAYRPQMAVTHFMNWALDMDDTRMKEYFYPELEKDVLFPLGYIAERSGHSRGSTVDLTLFDMTTEKEVDMGGTFDYFGELSHPDYMEITDEQYANRMILRDAMLAHGFKPLEEEWWHFTLADEPYPDTYFTFPVSSASVAGGEPAAVKEDPLSLWTEDAAARTELLSYMEAITDEGGADYIPPEDRIAVFDLDGTLFCETDPNYFDYTLLVYRVLEDPDYKDQASGFEREVAAKIVEQNETGASFPGLEVDHGKAIASAFSGLSLEEFNDYIQEFKKLPMPSYEGMTRGEGWYQPMLQVVEYLQANDFTIYVVSGTDRFIVRGIVDGSPLNIPPRQIIGSDETVVTPDQGDEDGLEYVYDDDDELVLGGEFVTKNLKMNKVAVIAQEIGQQPVLSFGNSTGDSSMAAYVTTGNPYPSLAFMLCCDDTERENGSVDKADKMYDLCGTYGWIPVSMKNDWTTIYGDGVTYGAGETTASVLIDTVEAGTFTMDYCRFGAGEDTLVILPGLSVQSVLASADAVAEAYQPLADEYTIYLFDRRNDLPANYSVYDMARDTAEAIQALGLEDVCLFGASQGGMIAMDMAIENPELVHKLILGSTSACVTEEQYGPIEKWIQLAKAGDAEGLYLAFGEELYPEDVFEQSRELLVEASKTVTDEELSRFITLAEGTKGFDVTGDLEKLACPVLVIGSSDDRVLGATATEQIAERLSGRSDVELYMYDGYGHAAYDTAPDYKERMLSFLSDDGEALAEIRESGVLRVGTTGDYKPMSFLDADTGEYWGFDTALAEDLAEALGVEIEYVPTTWPTLMEDTLAGKFDLAICGITVTDARQEQALMSDGYLGNGKTVLCRAEDAKIYTSLEAIDRPEVRVMENPGGLNEKFALENLPDAELIIHDVNEEIPGLVAAGEADVMITEIMEAGYYVGQDDRLAAPLIYEPFTQGQLGVLMPKGSEDLLDFVNGFLAEEKQSGRIDELAEEYIYRYITEDLDQAA